MKIQQPDFILFPTNTNRTTTMGAGLGLLTVFDQLTLITFQMAKFVYLSLSLIILANSLYNKSVFRMIGLHKSTHINFWYNLLFIWLQKGLQNLVAIAKSQHASIHTADIFSIERRKKKEGIIIKSCGCLF